MRTDFPVIISQDGDYLPTTDLIFSRFRPSVEGHIRFPREYSDVEIGLETGRDLFLYGSRPVLDAFFPSTATSRLRKI